MDDDEAMVAFIVEERVADPAQVVLGLLGQIDAGADAGVDEEVVAE